MQRSGQAQPTKKSTSRQEKTGSMAQRTTCGCFVEIEYHIQNQETEQINLSREKVARREMK